MPSLILVVVLAQQARAPADAPAPRGYVQGSVLLVSQPAGDAAMHPAGTASAASEPALGGQAFGLAVQAGRFLTPHVAVEGEFVFARPISGTQTLSSRSGTYYWTETYDADVRDLLFDAHVRWRPRVGSPVEIVGGGGLAISRVRKRNAVFAYTSPPAGPWSSPDRSETDHVLNVSAGADFPLSVSEATAIVPGVRLRWVHRVETSLASEVGAGGLGILLGAGIRGRFDRRPPEPARRGPAYVQGSFLVATHPAGTPNHRVSPALAGESFGVAASGGVFVTPVVAIEGEFVFGGIVSSPQTFSYTWHEDYVAEARDLLLNANVRLRPVRTGPFEIVLGGGIAFTRLAERERLATYVFYPRGAPEPRPDVTFRERAFNVGGGVDVPIPLGGRVSLVPMFRFRWIRRELEGQGAYMGVGRQMYQAGATIRARL